MVRLARTCSGVHPKLSAICFSLKLLSSTSSGVVGENESVVGSYLKTFEISCESGPTGRISSTLITRLGILPSGRTTFLIVTIAVRSRTCPSVKRIGGFVTRWTHLRASSAWTVVIVEKPRVMAVATVSDSSPLISPRESTVGENLSASSSSSESEYSYLPVDGERPARWLLVFSLCQCRSPGRLISRTSSAVTIFTLGLARARIAFIRVVFPELVSPQMSRFDVRSRRSQK